jgi:hypothetical protein
LWKVEWGIMVHIYNPSTWKVAAGGSGVWGNPGLCRKTLSKKKCVKLRMYIKSPRLIFLRHWSIPESPGNLMYTKTSKPSFQSLWFSMSEVDPKNISLLKQFHMMLMLLVGDHVLKITTTENS